MRVVLLSTETKHHTYFINKIAPFCDLAAIIYETRRLKKPYPTGPFFDDEQNAFEDRFFDPAFDGTPPSIPQSLAGRVNRVDTVNRSDIGDRLRALKPDLGISYGTGKIDHAIFDIPRFGTINIHRGIAELYRGLDSDLWAIHGGRFDCIGATIHYLDEGLDTGVILAQDRIALTSEDEIFHLRYKTSVLATRLVETLLRDFTLAFRPLSGRRQQTPGPYFSAMPLATKLQALVRFTEHRKSLSR